MRIVTGKASRLDFIGNFEVKPFPALAPGSCVARVVPIEEECGGKRLQVCSEVHRSGRLADTAFVARDGDNHARSFVYFCMYGNSNAQTDKNTEMQRGMQGRCTSR